MKLIYFRLFMKRKTILVFLILGLPLFLFNLNKNSVEQLRKSHLTYLQSSPFKTSLKLSKNQRKSEGLPPNKYYEREWELTMNPLTGKPEPEKVLALQNKIHRQRARRNVMRRSPGDAPDNPWIERGPNNVGGRTRALLFDPNDTSNKRVFAGGISGGLWVNNDITDSNSSWTRITGVPSNMAVSCITVDPNDLNTMYLGTGEMYTGGAVTGNGVYKSTDGGNNWTCIFGGEEANGQITNGQVMVSGVYFVQDIIAWDNNGSTEIFIAVGSSYIWSYRDNMNTLLGPNDYGVYRSTDNGTTWAKPSIPLSNNGNVQMPNDFEIGADNTLWLTTTGNYFGDDGGAILYTTDGATFVQKTMISGLKRTELAVSATDADKMYVLARTTLSKPIIYKTTDGFLTSPQQMTLPVDADSGIPADDFTREQAFYDLMIEVDPTDDDILYVGGIDLFRSTDGADSWDQISKWHGYITGNFGVVHADQHAMTFRPGNTDQAVFGNDGGVYYAHTLSGAASSSIAIASRNTDYNTTQFYRAAIAPTAADEYFVGGTQDNGSPYFYHPNSNGTDGSQDISGGDGGYCFIDQVGEEYLIVSYVYNEATAIYNNVGTSAYIISGDGNGDFINQAELDSYLDILYTNGSDFDSGNYRIYRFSDLMNLFTNPSGSVTQVILQDNLLNSPPTAFKVSPYTTTSTTLLVGTETGTLLRVSNADGGSPSWSVITGLNFLGSISDIEFGNTENEIYVTFHNYGIDHNIWYTNDGGATWEGKEGDLPDFPVKCILHNPLVSNEVIIGTELGVWKTQNFDQSSPVWVQTYNGMSDVKITDLQYRADGNTVLAATFGRGLFSGAFSDENLKIQTQKMISSSVTLYPTVSEGSFTIGTDKRLENIAVFVYNMEGRQVFRTSYEILDRHSPMEINLQVSKGIYIVKIFEKNQHLKTQEIIVK